MRAQTRVCEHTLFVVQNIFCHRTLEESVENHQSFPQETAYNTYTYPSNSAKKFQGGCGSWVNNSCSKPKRYIYTESLLEETLTVFHATLHLPHHQAQCSAHIMNLRWKHLCLYRVYILMPLPAPVCQNEISKCHFSPPLFCYSFLLGRWKSCRESPAAAPCRHPGALAATAPI